MYWGQCGNLRTDLYEEEEIQGEYFPGRQHARFLQPADEENQISPQFRGVVGPV